MNVLFCACYCWFMVLSANVGDIPLYNEGYNDFVIIETIEDYEGNIVPSVDDEFVDEPVEDNGSEGVVDDSVVEQITVNQTVVDNTEVLEKMDKLDYKLSLLNDSFNSVLTSSPSSYLQPTIYRASAALFTGYFKVTDMSSNTSSNLYKLYLYDLSNVSSINYTFLTDIKADRLYLCNDFAFNTNITDYLQVTPINTSSDLDVGRFNYLVVYSQTKDYQIEIGVLDSGSSGGGGDVSGDEPVNPNPPSITVTYPQEVINNVNTIKNELVTLQYLTVLNITLPMIIACIKRITFPNRKEINK